MLPDSILARRTRSGTPKPRSTGCEKFNVYRGLKLRPEQALSRVDRCLRLSQYFLRRRASLRDSLYINTCAMLHLSSFVSFIEFAPFSRASVLPVSYSYWSLFSPSLLSLVSFPFPDVTHRRPLHLALVHIQVHLALISCFLLHMLLSLSISPCQHTARISMSLPKLPLVTSRVKLARFELCPLLSQFIRGFTLLNHF